MGHNMGLAMDFILSHVSYDGDDCLIWPFAIDRSNGRGRLSGGKRKGLWAQAKLAALYGVKPQTIGMILRGEIWREGHSKHYRKFTSDQIADIRGSPLTAVELSEKYGVHRNSIGRIRRGEAYTYL